jgi:hypothetical protein
MDNDGTRPLRSLFPMRTGSSGRIRTSRAGHGDPVSTEDKLTAEEIAEIRGRCDRASAGPWRSMIEGRDHASGNNFIMTGPANARGDDIELSGATTDEQELIAQARQDVPRLLEEVRRGRSMTRGKLLAFHRRPIGFEYPAGFKRAIQRGLVDLGAWTVLDAGHAVALGHGLRQRYPARSVVPFARRVDNDDVACFDVEAPGAVVVIHDYASAGWEARVYRDFYAWLRQAVADMVERDEIDDEAERRERVRWKKTWCTDCNQGWVVPLRPPGTSEVLWTCVECESVWTERRPARGGRT